MNNAIDQLAKEHDLDADSLQNLVSFLIQRTTATPEAASAFLADPDSVIRDGVVAWRATYTTFFSELMYGTSDNAKNTRAQLAEETYNQIREGAAI